MRPRNEDGTTIPLIIGLVGVLAMGVAVVTDASAAYLQRQGLDNLADGAALAGADLGAAGDDVYTGGIGDDRLAITEAEARAAGRAYALAPDDASGQQQATAAAAVAMADQGLGDTAWDIHVSCGDLPDCHVGGAVITVRVETHVALPFVPDVLGGQTAFALDAEHDVPIGQYQEAGGSP
jgi:hypothetical protein